MLAFVMQAEYIAFREAVDLRSRCLGETECDAEVVQGRVDLTKSRRRPSCDLLVDGAGGCW
jgi:hypothetical protein